MSLAAWPLAGLVVARRGDGLVDDPVAALFAHSPETSAPPDLVVDVAATTGPAPDPGGEPRCFHGEAKVRARGDHLIVHDGSACIAVDDGVDGVVDVGVEVTGLRLAIPADPVRRSVGVADVTLLLGLILALRRHRRFHLHAGLLSRGDDGVLVIGTSGAGKTTTCLALHRAGYTLHGDDVAFLGEGGRAWALPRALHVGAQTARAFPDVADRLGPPLVSGKRPLVLSASTSPSGVTIRRLILPAIGAAATTTTTTTTATTPTQAEVFGALLEAGAFVVVDGLPGAELQLALLAALAALPATALTIGSDALDDAGVIGRALEVAP